MTARYGYPSFLDKGSAREAEWGAVRDRYEAKKRVAVSPGAEVGDEVRWGDSTELELLVPAAAGPTAPFTRIVQLLQVQRPARVWSIEVALDLVNPEGFTQQVGENIISFFGIQRGVGSSTISRLEVITLPLPFFPGPFGNALNLIEANVPARTIYVSVAFQFAALAFPTDRTVRCRLHAHVSPVFR